MIHAAITEHRRPSLAATWTYYQYNRIVGKALIPNENRCAIIMSMTLGLAPRAGEKTLADLGNKTVWDFVRSAAHALIQREGWPPQGPPGEVAKRIYVTAGELAARLRDEWGEPLALNGEHARGELSTKRGVIYLEKYDRPDGRTGNHFDLWDKDHQASSTSIPFEKAHKVLLWELP